MKKNIKIYTLLILFLLLFMSLSQILGGKAGSVLYILSFALPLLFGFVYSSRDKVRREEERGISEPPDRLFELNREGLCLTLPLVFPAAALVFFISYLTFLLFSLVGIGASLRPEGSVFYLILVYAVAPAVLEELVFRYLPIKLLSPYSKKATIIVSSVYFGFFHLDFLKIPYALVAGVLFIVIDLSLESVIPSVLLHLCNNIISVVWIKSEGWQTAFLLTFALLVLLSLVFIAVFRKRYIEKVKLVMKERKACEITYIVLLIPLIAIIEFVIKLF